MALLYMQVYDKCTYKHTAKTYILLLQVCKYQVGLSLIFRLDTNCEASRPEAA